MLVYRDGKLRLLGPDLLRDVQSAFARAAAGDFDRDRIITALIAAGELECALADAASPSLPAACAATDSAAEALLRGESTVLRRALDELLALEVPDVISVSRAEGFAYYALHPLQFANLSRAVIAA